MKHIFSILLWLGMATWAYSQEKRTISGYIKDASNGESLIGVSVYVREIGNGTVTNDYGYYALNLPTGVSYTLVFNYIGYEKVEKKVTLTDDLKLSIELKDESVKLQEVIVKTTKEDENVKNIEMSVNKVEMKTIRQMPALLGEVDLVRSIQLLPGAVSYTHLDVYKRQNQYRVERRHA